MQIIKVCLILLLTSVLFADENQEIIPQSIQKSAEDLADDITNDGLNSKFLVNLQHIDPEVNGYGYHQLANRTELGTVGVFLLPNTWKINLAYTKEIGDNLLFKTGRTDAAEKVNDNPSDYDFVMNEKEKDFSWIDLYMKPISGSWGEIGFGYLNLQNSVTIVAEPHAEQTFTLLNVQNNAGTGAYTVGPLDKIYFKYNEKIQKFYVTYNIQPQDRWYDGFGLSYNYEKSNRAQEINKDLVIDPDMVSHTMSIGFIKTLNEIDSGISFKTLTVGYVQSSIEYHNYNTNRNETFDLDSNEINAELIFMKKWESGRKIYLSGKIISKLYDSDRMDEIKKLELGFLF